MTFPACCSMCHVNSTEQNHLPAMDNLNPVIDPMFAKKRYHVAAADSAINERKS